MGNKIVIETPEIAKQYSKYLEEIISEYECISQHKVDKFRING